MLDRSRGGFLGGGTAGGTVTGDITMASGTRLILDPGTIGAPSLAFSNSLTTGLASLGTDQMQAVRASSSHFQISSAGATVVSKLVVPAGTLAAPSISFSGSDAGTGFSAQTADAVVLGRVGVSQMAGSSGLITFGSATAVTFAGTVTANSSLIANSAFRLAPTVSAGDYTVLNTSNNVIMTSGSNLTLPAAPTTSQVLVFSNATGGAVTIVRGSGHTINGAAANPTVASGAQAWLVWNSAASDWRISEAGAA